MTDKTYITSDNIGKFAKVQNAQAMASRGNIVLMWDELDRSQKRLARKHIDIPEIEVHTSDTYKVPDKWSDNVIEAESDPEATDLIKQVIANPSRYDVYEQLVENDPPEPLMLWWANVCFSEQDYFELLAEVCRYGLFRTDTKYLWAVMAFGVEPGRGKFYWPESEGLPPEEKSVKKKVLEKFDIPEKELELAWDDVKKQLAESVELTEGEAEAFGVEVEADEDDEDSGSSTPSLLDF